MRAAALSFSIAATLLIAGPAGAASTFYIRGGGYGHGIGMSQYGAYGYALHGKSYKFILAHYYRGTALGEVDPSRTVRVLLENGPAAFSGATRAGGKSLNPSVTYSVRALGNGSLVLINQFGKKIGTFQPPLTATGPGPLNVVGLGVYRGALVFRANGPGSVQTVDAVGLDDYVRGVVSAEMSADWAPQALEAQAVAARTYAITANAGGADFDLYPDTRSQMYRGVSAETPVTDAAVAATRGQVVTYNGAPVVTYFFSSSGGYTEDVQNVWQGATPEPWLQGVPDPYDGAGGDPYHSWRYQMPTSGAAARLGRLVKGSLIGVRVTRHGASPRVLTADVVGSAGGSTVTGLQLQHTFGLMTTYATFTTISTLPGLPPPAIGSPLEARAAMEAVSALSPLVRELLAEPIPAIHGSIFPAPAGTAISIQAQTGRGWQTVGHARLAKGGSYVVQLAAAGTYRIVYGSLDGPSVGLS